MAATKIDKGTFKDGLVNFGINAREIETGAGEIVYSAPHPDNLGVDVRIYSSVDRATGITRDTGKDAIRVVAWDPKKNVPLGKAKRINRVGNVHNIFSRLRHRIKSLDFQSVDYIRAILEDNEQNGFARKLLASLEEYGRLTPGQLAYVIGEKSPKGFDTFEAKTIKKNPDFKENFLANSEPEPEPTEVTGPEVEDFPQLPFDEDGDMPRGKSNVIKAEDVELVPTKGYPYKFDFFNPVQSSVYPYRAKNVNIVIGANTSAGKTICAEIVMEEVFKRGERVVYLSPLKSLTQEKYDDWQERFSDKTIEIMTGDYVLKESKKKALDKADIIVMTSEMADSRTRKFHSEKNWWMKQVGLIVVDESHILTTDRGHAVEVGLMRFTKLNPDARVVLLSATMPNVDELGAWLEVLNGKTTSVINCDWRPVELQLHIEEYPVVYRGTWMDYHATEKKKRDSIQERILEKPDEKFLVFVHSKAAGRLMIKELAELGIRSEFHSADLDLEERLEIERAFSNRSGGLRVLVSTSTLAWGRNLPARNVAICGIHRGMTEVDQLDIIQMAGRAGRYMIDDEGFVYLFVPPGEIARWKEIFKNPRPVKSVLADINILSFHILSEVQTKAIRSKRSMMLWYRRSLAYLQNSESFGMEDAEELLETLLGMEMLSDNGFLRTTSLGDVSALLYYTPFDIYAWYKNFKHIKDNGLDFSDETLAWAISHAPSYESFIPKDIARKVDGLAAAFRSLGLSPHGDYMLAATALFDAISGEKMEGALRAVARNITWDMDRIVSAISMADKRYAGWEFDELWKMLPVRFKYGIPKKLIELVSIEGVGGARAKKLYEAGFTKIEEVADPTNQNRLYRVFNPAMAKKVAGAARKKLEDA